MSRRERGRRGGDEREEKTRGTERTAERREGEQETRESQRETERQGHDGRATGWVVDGERTVLINVVLNIGCKATNTAR